MMGRRSRGGGHGEEELHVNVPSFFRCPISLDVMRSPVSLCTGVTYDRSSIQTWLDTGHNTCPATMQILPTTDFVPNHTLHRLIQHWSSQSLPPPPPPPPPANPEPLLRTIPSDDDPLPSLRQLAEVAADATRIGGLADNAATLPTLYGVLLREGLAMESMEAAVRILAKVLNHRKGRTDAVPYGADPRALPSLVAVLGHGSLDARIAAAWIVEASASDGPEIKLRIAETEGMLAELLRLVAAPEEKTADPRAVEAGLAALVVAASPRRVRPRIVELGVIGALGRLLERASTGAAVAERALTLMEIASTCTEGRAAICKDPATVGAVVARMTRVKAEAGASAIAVLWSVCCLARDRRAQDAATSGGGLAKVLLVVQRNCSPAARQMGGDLLKVLGANAKGGLPSYDSKTIHISPF